MLKNRATNHTATVFYACLFLTNKKKIKMRLSILMKLLLAKLGGHKEIFKGTRMAVEFFICVTIVNGGVL